MGSDGDEATDIELEKSLRRPISTVVFVIAMQAEAQPLVNKFGLSDSPPLGVGGKGLPWVVYQALHPDILINARTCGAFKLKGANIGDVFLASHLLFHHRTIPTPMFHLYGVGLRQAFSTPNLLKDLNLKVYLILSTGDSLDMSTQDESLIIANDATLKDMEGAAVAYVAELLKVPVMFLKAVTDLIDGDKPTAEEFLQNLSTRDLCS